MATDPNTMNIADYAMLYGSKVDKAIAYSLYKNTNSIFKDVMFKTRKTLQRQGARVTNGDQLPDMNWADVNEDPQIVKGSQAPYSESAWLIENVFKKPKILGELEEAQGEDDWFTRQYNDYQKTFVHKTNEAFFNGLLPQHAPGVPRAEYVDKECKGLKLRMSDGSMAPDMMIDAGGVNISSSGTKASSLAFFAALRAIADNAGVDDLTDWVLYMPAEVKTAMWTAAANAGAGAGFGTDKDAFNRSVETFMGAKVRTVGRKKNQYGRILPIDEDATGVSPTGGDGTVANGVRTFAKNRASIWAVHHEEGAFEGWQGGPLTMKKVGDTDNGVWEQALVRWYGGFWVPDTRSIARLYNIGIG